MKKITFNVQEPYKSFLLNGEKTIETRLNKGKFKDLEAGDILKFEDTLEEFQIIETRDYPTFREMLKKEGIKKIMPDQDNLDDSMKVYRKFYTEEKEIEYGVIAIELKKSHN